MRFKLIIFFDGIEVNMFQFTMPDISTLNAQSNKNKNFITRKIGYIEMEKAITNKTLPMKTFDLLDSFTIL